MALKHQQVSYDDKKSFGLKTTMLKFSGTSMCRPSIVHGRNFSCRNSWSESLEPPRFEFNWILLVLKNFWFLRIHLFSLMEAYTPWNTVKEEGPYSRNNPDVWLPYSDIVVSFWDNMQNYLEKNWDTWEFSIFLLITEFLIPKDTKICLITGSEDKVNTFCKIDL